MRMAANGISKTMFCPLATVHVSAITLIVAGIWALKQGQGISPAACWSLIGLGVSANLIALYPDHLLCSRRKNTENLTRSVLVAKDETEQNHHDYTQTTELSISDILVCVSELKEYNFSLIESFNEFVTLSEQVEDETEVMEALRPIRTQFKDAVKDFSLANAATSENFDKIASAVEALNASDCAAGGEAAFETCFEEAQTLLRAVQESENLCKQCLCLKDRMAECLQKRRSV